MRAKLAAFGLLGVVLPAAAQPLGGEQRANTYTTFAQNVPSLGMDLTGRWVVVWQSAGQEQTETSGIFGQQFSPAGTPFGIEFHVNSSTTGNQKLPRVSRELTGQFVVVWESAFVGSSSYEIVARYFGASGDPVGSDFRVNTNTNLAQSYPSVGHHIDGFLVAWQSNAQDGSLYGIYGQRLDGAGNPYGSEFRVNFTVAGSQTRPAVSDSLSASFIVAWQSAGQDGDLNGIYAQRYDSVGSPLGGEFRANFATTGNQGYPAVGARNDDSFVIAWESTAPNGLFAQRFDRFGAPLGPEFRVSTYTTGAPRHAAVAVSASGAFVIAWQVIPSDGSNAGILARRFTQAGAPIGPEFRVNSFTTGNQVYPSVSTGPEGRFALVWQSSDQAGAGSLADVYAQAFCFVKGDANGDGTVSVSDILYLINNLFAGGPAPLGCADVNADGSVNVSDVLYLINYLFAGGPAPV